MMGHHLVPKWGLFEPWPQKVFETDGELGQQEAVMLGFCSFLGFSLLS